MTESNQQPKWAVQMQKEIRLELGFRMPEELSNKAIIRYKLLEFVLKHQRFFALFGWKRPTFDSPGSFKEWLNR